MTSNSSPIPKNESLIKGIRLALTSKPKTDQEEAAAKDDQEHEEEAKVDRERSTHTVARKTDDKEINFDLDRPLKCALSDVFNKGGSVVITIPDSSYAQVSY